MPFCVNCGAKISPEAKFCPECGHKVPETKPSSSIPPQPIPQTTPKKAKQDKSLSALAAGKIFNGTYKIEKILTRDNDGINYLVTDENTGEKRVLKIFYSSYFDNVSTLLESVTHLSQLVNISNPYLAKVLEVNHTNKPAYLVSEYIDGIKLAKLKEQNPSWFTEDNCRKIALQLINAAITLRRADLSVKNLSLNNIVKTNDDTVKILTSGISYEAVDERDDIFNFGLLLAKLFSSSAFYDKLYSKDRILSAKFNFISGITVDLNELIAKCVNKNPSQRFATFEDLEAAFKNLPEIAPDRIFQSAVPESIDTDIEAGEEIAIPKRGPDIYFWLIIVGIAAFVFLITFTNVLDTIFNPNNTGFKFTGFLASVPDSINEMAPLIQDNYRNPKSSNMAGKIQPKPLITPNRIPPSVNPEVNIPPAQPLLTTPPPTSDYTINQPKPQIHKPANLPTTPDGMVYIYGDTFAYGTLDKKAQDNASLNGFYIAQAEVTQAEWNRIMKAAPVSLAGDNLPVENISWFDAVQYCNLRSTAEGLTPCYTLLGMGSARTVSCNFKAKGYRLPTEAEWEYAARAKSFTKYSGSNQPDVVAWYKDNAQAHIHPVKSKEANAFGLYDMTGNVAEWCWDWYDENYPKTMPYINPTGPLSGSSRAIRGGNINTNSGKELEVIYRDKGIPSKAYRFVGFRVVRAK
ncbi:MAG TPA: SUMF1/EgtB/PvdO family nonheme iron enzyme [Candidatus Cloacimonadota bacterium]|nr:SUMF1/EgtB/PvdO family nonheme iron enzyme [Candidatus Cloacimonadota bacterium]HQL15620.1 SUMF1/EgtB/PvdO family nonheme iron enzyme [Candidatus Cloacimonadota bacterium]